LLLTVLTVLGCFFSLRSGLLDVLLQDSVSRSHAHVTGQS
jgi:hypothetical protein